MENEHEKPKDLTDLINVLVKYESRHDYILNKQLQIHARQLNILLGAATFFILFIIISAIYCKVMVTNIREAEQLQTSELKKQDRVKTTIEKFEEMWAWYYSAMDSDPLFRRFASVDSILYQRDEGDLLKDRNINRFYNYFEVFKSMDKSNILDRATAQNLLPFFGRVGRRTQFDSIAYVVRKLSICKNKQDSSSVLKSQSYYVFNYIDRKRQAKHEKCMSGPAPEPCNCGEILDGYEYILKGVLRTEVPKTNTDDHIED